MEHNDALRRVLASLSKRDAGRALTDIANFLAVWPNSAQQAELDALRNEYELMARYWRQGFKEPRLQELYDGILHRIYTLYANTSLWRRMNSSPFMSSVYSNLMQQTREWSVANMRQELEAFVSDIAMVELEPANKQDARRDALYSRHYERMSNLFDYIWASRMWTDATASAFEDMLLSPTLDANDQQLIVSAMTLSIINMFDMSKFRVLANVYMKSTVESVRQRALVGWVMGRSFTLSKIFPEEKALVDEMLTDERVRQELTELQIQMIFCINTENDNEKINSEIMPELMRNNNLRITRDGIEEVEEDPMEDILHPEAGEERMEKLEEGFRKIVDMQKQGSDIYFSGFAQMKRFPFFQRVSNWFLPFSFDHPEVRKSIDKKYEPFLNRLLSSGSFCSSDRFSFMFAYHQVFERLPQTMRDVMARNEMPLDELTEVKDSTPAYIRRSYLQDMYRFVRLFPHAGQFDHPFLKDHALGHVLFFASPLFQDSPLESHFNKVTSLLIRQRQYDEAHRLLDRYSRDGSKDFQYYMMRISALQHSKSSGTSDIINDIKSCYEQALRLKPDSDRALQGYARTLFTQAKYDEAIEVYDRLILMYPEKKSLELNKMICLTKLGRYEDALKTLFQLNYEAPDDDNTTRVLAWVLTGVGKYEQALSLYEKLLANDSVVVDDLLNKGYCEWFAGNINAATKLFSRYLQDTGEQAGSIIENERGLIEEKGITEPEMMMMVDSISS